MPMSVAKLGSFLKSLDFSGNLLGGRISVRYAYGSPATTSISIIMNSDKPTTTYCHYHWHCHHSHHYLLSPP